MRKIAMDAFQVCTVFAVLCMTLVKSDPDWALRCSASAAKGHTRQESAA